MWPVKAIEKKKIQVSVKMPHVNSWETYQVKQEDWKPGVLKFVPFTWKNKKLRLENQMVRDIPKSFRKSWTAIWGDELFPLFLVC